MWNRHRPFILVALLFVALLVGFGYSLYERGYLKSRLLPMPLPARLRIECMDVMGKGDCVIMHNAAYLPAEVKQVFISGYGSLSADVYRGLRTAGIGMCKQIEMACRETEDSEICLFGKAMYDR